MINQWQQFSILRCLSARHQPIMLIFSSIMLCCSAQIFDLLCSCERFDCSIIEYNIHLYKNGDCSIRVYQSKISHYAQTYASIIGGCLLSAHLA